MKRRSALTIALGAALAGIVAYVPRSMFADSKPLTGQNIADQYQSGTRVLNIPARATILNIIGDASEGSMLIETDNFGIASVSDDFYFRLFEDTLEIFIEDGNFVFQDNPLSLGQHNDQIFVGWRYQSEVFITTLNRTGDRFYPVQTRKLEQADSQTFRISA